MSDEIQTKHLFSGLFKWATLVFLLLAAIAAVFALVFELRSVVTLGTVVSARFSQNALVFTEPDSGRLYYPIIEYEASKNVFLRFESSLPYLGKAPNSGEKIAIRYVPGEDRQASIDSFVNKWIIFLVFSSLSLVFFLSWIVKK